MSYLPRRKIAKYLAICVILLVLVRLKLQDDSPMTMLYKYVEPADPDYESMDREAELALAQSASAVVLWMDIPNAFPWRHCLQGYNNIISVLSCEKVVVMEFKVGIQQSLGLEKFPIPHPLTPHTSASRLVYVIFHEFVFTWKAAA